jgi:pimeloyl-ACP methyl ester carboxylesterase
MKNELMIAGVPVFVEGDGEETIIMVHGWPDTYRVWDKQVAFFKKKHRCVTLTLPGFGEQRQPKGYTLDHLMSVLEQVVDHVSPAQKVTLMLHDWGCVFGYQFAMSHPNRVARIIAIDVGDANSPVFKKELSVAAKLMLFAYQITLALAWYLGGRVGDAITRGMCKALQGKAELSHVHSGMNYPYAMRWMGALGSFNALRQVEPACPFFYAFGRKKPFMFQSRVWTEKLSRSSSNVVRGFDSGHWVMIDCADEFNTAVGDWLTA